jgi:hypothetical protein
MARESQATRPETITAPPISGTLATGPHSSRVVEAPLGQSIAAEQVGMHQRRCGGPAAWPRDQCPRLSLPRAHMRALFLLRVSEEFDVSCDWLSTGAKGKLSRNDHRPLTPYMRPIPPRLRLIPPSDGPARRPPKPPVSRPT